MAVVWSAVCALAALAAGVEQARAGEGGPQMRTRVLPGHGYVRYEVLPGDEEAEPGEVIVVHEERRPAREAAAEEPVGGEVGAAPGDNLAKDRAPAACSGLRAKLVARLFEIQGMQIEPEFAAWLERNLNLGTSGVRNIRLLGGDSLLLTALKSDGVARGLAEDLARCERR